MLNINSCAFTGRLTHDAELKGSGTPFAVLQVAVNNSYKDKNGEWKDDTAFLTVKAFGQTAERCGSLRKGQPVYVDGRIKQENWEQDGQKRSKLVVSAMSVKAFEVPKKGDSGDSGGNYTQPARGYEQPKAESTTQAASDAGDDVPW